VRCGRSTCPSISRSVLRSFLLAAWVARRAPRERQPPPPRSLDGANRGRGNVFTLIPLGQCDTSAREWNRSSASRAPPSNWYIDHQTLASKGHLHPVMVRLLSVRLNRTADTHEEGGRQ
jgi:hypothetical protein